MAGTMSRADLRAELKGSLHDSASVLSDPDDFDRCLQVAVSDLSRLLPRTLVASLALFADVAEYVTPADFLSFKMALWGVSTPVKPWDKAHPGRLPDVLHMDDVLVLSPAPTAAQIGLLGSVYRFFYFAGYALDDVAANTTVPVIYRDLLLLRAQAECCKELAMRGVTKPVALRDGVSSGPRNGTPAALWQALMDSFEARARR